MKTAAGRRVLTHGRGRAAERLALLWLLGKGWRPLARRFAVPGGEIDLVMRRGRTIAFVEVKARGTLDAASTAIDGGKRRRISRAARAWLTRHPDLADLTFRADAVFLAPGSWPRHAVAIFELDLRS